MIYIIWNTYSTRITHFICARVVGTRITNRRGESYGRFVIIARRTVASKRRRKRSSRGGLKFTCETFAAVMAIRRRRRRVRSGRSTRPITRSYHRVLVERARFYRAICRQLCARFNITVAYACPYYPCTRAPVQ